MNTRFTLILALQVALLAPFVASSGAAVIASTTFDGRSLPSANTAGNLNWVVNGVADPGTMSAFTFGGAAQPLMDNTTLVQNMFSPNLNVGNAPNDATRSWTTSVSLTALPGLIVAVESVSFDYWAISGVQVQQGAGVFRNSDFIVTLFDPSMNAVGTVSQFDVLNGNNSGAGTPVTLTFNSPITLTDPGTYTLQIRAGDIDDNETGNHTAIDNLSINGTVIPEPSKAVLLLAGLLGLAIRRRR